MNDHKLKRVEIREAVFDLMLELEINYLPVNSDFPKKLRSNIRYYYGGLTLLKMDLGILSEYEYYEAVLKGKAKIQALKLMKEFYKLAN